MKPAISPSLVLSNIYLRPDTMTPGIDPHGQPLDPKMVQSQFEDMSAPVTNRNGAVTRHLISTTIGGKKGEPKQKVSYMAERVVGTGSFGIVFQAKCIETEETGYQKDFA